MNYMKTALLLAALTGFFLVVGYLLGGQTGLVMALVVALGMNLFAYWNSDSMVLRMANALCHWMNRLAMVEGPC